MNRTTNQKNVWNGIHQESSRRVKSEGEYNFFWICDDMGRYGLLISLNQTLTEKDFKYKIRGITIVINNKDENDTDLYLVLNDNSDWEIFLSLCTDLLNISEKSTNEVLLIVNLRKRLKRWQVFLSEETSLSLPETKQMGLIAELLCLQNTLLPNLPPNDAVVSWVGPDFDRQDFSLTNFFIEVKSYISSKGAIVSISSLHQLVNDIKPLYLLAYGLSRNNNGVSIVDVALAISSVLGTESESSDLFEQKLAQYGYIEGVTEEPFFKYHADSVKCFAITDSFPRIIPRQVQEEILSVQYKVDLSRCASFEVDLNTIFK